MAEGRPGICELTVIADTAASYKSIDVGWNVLGRFTFDAGHLIFVKQCIFRTKKQYLVHILSRNQLFVDYHEYTSADLSECVFIHQKQSKVPKIAPIERLPRSGNHNTGNHNNSGRWQYLSTHSILFGRPIPCTAHLGRFESHLHCRNQTQETLQISYIYSDGNSKISLYSRNCNTIKHWIFSSRLTGCDCSVIYGL